MSIDDLLKTMRAPLDFFRSKVMGVKNIEGKAKIDVQRFKGNIAEMKDEAAEYGGKAKGAAGQAQQGAQAAQSKKGKMGLFSKKKACPSCGQKLHPSWDQCPFCGYGSAAPAPEPAAAAPAPAPKMRTMALDTGAASSGPVGSSVGWLVPLEGPMAGELFQLKGRVIVGSKDDCDVCIKDPSISGRHAEFIAARHGFKLNDLGSTNGTYVNDKRISSTELVDGDSVKLGRTNFKFKSMS
jgi:hypothetical protein